MPGPRKAPGRPYPEDFGIATHLTQALFNLKQNVWTLMPAGKEPVLPTIAGVFPWRRPG